MRSVLILSVMNGAAWGGSEELWYHSALWLAKNGYKVGVCFYNWPGKNEKINSLSNAGCELYLLPGKKETKTIMGKWKLYKAFKKIPFPNYEDVIVSQGGWKDIAYPPFKKLFKVLPGYCLCFHNYDPSERLSSKRKKILQKWMNNANANLAASKQIFETLNRNFSIESPNQKILINPISFYQPEHPLSYPSPQEKIIFTMLASLDIKRKAQDILIGALSTEKWKQRNWELHLYGEGADHEQLENIIGKHKLQSKIFLKGFTKDVKDVIAFSHLVLQITHKDAMPISVMEAMAMGRPVIVSNIGDMPDWVIPGENGWIINKIDITSIDQMLETAWSKKEQWELMGKKAFETFKKLYPADPVKFFLQQCKLI